ncbi:hypothetical protein HDU76_008404, partial [Blyttiomyces sp. JEL0837]
CGYFSESDHRPILLLDDNDELDTVLETIPYDPNPVCKNVLSSPLIHIAMRQCWMEDLQPLIRINRHRLFLLAIKMRHEELAMKMAIEWGLIDITSTPLCCEFKEGMEELGRTGSLTFLMFVMRQRDLGNNWDTILSLVLRKIIHGAMEASRLSFLRFIQREYGKTPTLSDAFGQPQLYECFITESWDCWEWTVDVCNSFNLPCDTLLVVKNIDKARRVVQKLGGNQTIGYQFLRHAANYSNHETFEYLWNHRNRNEFGSLSLGNETNSDNARFKLIDVFLYFDILTVDAVRFYHSQQPRRNKIVDIFYSIARQGNLDVVEYLYSTGDIVLDNPLFIRAIKERNLNVIKLFGGSRGLGNINTAASRGNLDAVKFFHQNCCDETTGNNTNSDGAKTCVNMACRKMAAMAFGSAALRGDFEMVTFFIENAREDCSLEKGLSVAIKCGSFRLVRYFYGLGVTELKDNGVLADVEKWLVSKDGKGKMAGLVLKHFFVGKEVLVNGVNINVASD